MNLIFEIAHESTLNDLYTKKLPRLYPVNLQVIENDVLSEKGISLTVLRFDEIHPIISGNKLFKLHYFLEEIKRLQIHQVVTFGGAFSNHLVAAAYCCKINKLQCTGVVRGEEPAVYCHTLQQCVNYGMRLKFVSRQAYKQKDEPGFLKEIAKINEEYYSIPEGGCHTEGARGAALMMDYVPRNATHIACAVGTATTVAGLLTRANEQQRIIALPVLKGMNDLDERINFLTGKKYTDQQLVIKPNYHFGGYAKATPELFEFMNHLFEEYHLPTDFVYTAKMMYGIMDMIEQDFFAAGSNIVCMHTGGLQGNLSLQKNILTFT